MRHDPGTFALFAEPSDAARAIHRLRESGFGEISAAMPAPFPEVMDALERPRSRVGVGVFLSTVIGVSAGFALCITTSRSWPLITGGMPIVSLPAFTVIAFESAVLIAGMTTHAVLAYATVTGRWRRQVPVPEPRLTVDRVGVFVTALGTEPERILREAGAEEVRRVA